MLKTERKSNYSIRQDALIETIRFMGDRKNLRKLLKIKKNRLNKWLNVISTKIPYEYCMIIASVTGINIERLSPFTPEANKIFNELQAQNKKNIQYPVSQIVVRDSFFDPNTIIGSAIIVGSGGVLISGLLMLQLYQVQGKLWIPAMVLDLRALILKANSPIPLHLSLLISEKIAISFELKKILGSRQGVRSDLKNKALPTSENLKNESSLRSLGYEVSGRTDAWIAQVLGFGSKELLNRAQKIYLQGSHALITAVNEGKVPITVAAKMLEKPAALEAFEIEQRTQFMTGGLKNDRV